MKPTLRIPVKLLHSLDLRRRARGETPALSVCSACKAKEPDLQEPCPVRVKEAKKRRKA